MGDTIFGISMTILIIGAIVAIIVGKKVKENKDWERRREEQIRLETEEKSKVKNLKNKIKNNQITQGWIEKITNICKSVISKNPNYDLSWEIVTEKQDFYFGHNLQRVHYENLRSTDYAHTPTTLLKYHFAEVGLPEFDNNKESSKFAKAMAQIVKDKLTSDGFDIKVKEYDRTIVYRSDSSCWFDGGCKLYVIKYTRKKVEGNW